VLAVGVGVIARLPVWESEADVLVGHVLRHLEHEPEAFEAVLRPMDRARVDGVLAAHRVSIAETTPIVYAQTCIVDGKRMAHLVVRGPSGAVTVMLLPGERLADTETLEAGGLFGRIVPTSGGSVAIVGHDQAVDQAAEEQIVGAVDWEA
jgi:hypothetical protein